MRFPFNLAVYALESNAVIRSKYQNRKCDIILI